MPAPPGQAASADASSSLAIMAAIYDIAVNKSGVSFKGGKQALMPEADEIKGNWPFFVVLAPRFVGGEDASGALVTGRIPRMPGLRKPVNDYLCYGIWPYRAPKDARTATTPEKAKVLLEKAFAIYYTLEQTAMISDVVQCMVVPKMEFTDGHSEPYTAVKLVLRVTERLNVDYVGL